MREQNVIQPMPVIPEHLRYATAYIPYQYFNTLFDPKQGLEHGTIFPELVDNISKAM